jgi:hypothetical protein
MRILPVILVGALLVVGGCGKSGDETMAKKAGKTVGNAVVDFGSGVGQGVDEKMLAKVDLGEGLTKAGVTLTSAKGMGLENKGVTIYLTTKTPLKGTLLAKAVNKEGKEIGRATAEVDYAADDGKSVGFVFDKDLDTQLVDKFLVDIKK